MSKQTQFFIRKYDDNTDRLDENYNDPRYDEIKTLLAKSKYEVVSVGDSRILIDITKGKTPKGLMYIEDGIPFLRAENISDEKIHIDSAKKIDEKFHISSKLKNSQLRRGNVLITMAGKIGECALYDYDQECNCNQAIAILTINHDKISPRYLIKCLNSRLGQLQFAKLQKIVDQPNIGFDEIKLIQIPYPNTLEEQDDIVRSLKNMENKMEEIDQIIQQIKEKTNNLFLEKINLKSTPKDLTYFFKTGKSNNSSYFYLPFNDLNERFHYYFHIPQLDFIQKLCKLYSTTTLSNMVSQPIRKGEQPEYASEGIIAIKTVDLKDAYIDYDNCLKTTVESFNKFSFAQVKMNDILIASTGYVSLGKVDVYNKKDPALASQDISIVTLQKGYDPYFITYFLRSMLGKIQFEKWWTGSSGQIHLQTEDLNKFVIPDNSENGIPLKKQQEIAKEITDELTRLDGLIDKKNELIHKSQDNFEQMILNSIN